MKYLEDKLIDLTEASDKFPLNFEVNQRQNDDQVQFLIRAVECDLSLTKTDSPDPVYVGENLTYTVAVTNNGPSPATGVTLFDVMPANVTIVSASSTKGTCNHSESLVTCNIGSMPINDVATVTIVIKPTTPGAINNVANVSGNEHDPDLTNNTATQDTTVWASTDLAVTKTASADSIYVGENLTYTIAVTNNGPWQATGVTMTDTLPAGVTYVSASSTKGTCSHSENQVTCSIGTMTLNEVETVTIIVKPTAPGTITNTATVSGIEHDPNLDNNTATLETIVQATADLAITKTTSDEPVYAGENLTYIVAVTNNGLWPATGVTITDTLPAGVTYVSASSTKGTCSHSETQVTCNIGPIAINELVTVTIIVTPTTFGIINNVATVIGNEHDPNPDNNTATLDINVLASTDLAITKTASTDPVYVGENLTYNVDVTNIGPSTASGVIMTDTLPAGVTYVSASSTKGTCIQSGSYVTCSIGTMTLNEVVSITIIVTPTTLGIISNVANVSGIEHDPDPANNTATLETTVLTSADLALTNAPLPNTVFVGENLTYTVIVANNGPSAAIGVTLFDSLPTNVTFVSASSTKGTCNHIGTQVICNIDSMAVDELVTVTIIVIPTIPGNIINTTIVNGNEHDPNLSNNIATQKTAVQAMADLAITKTASADPVYAGKNLIYTVAVTNNGPWPATGVIMADTLPAGVTYVSASSTKGTCSHSEAQVTCDIGPIAINEVVTVTIIVMPTVPGTITNTVTAIGNEHDPDPDNNTATKNTTALASTDLAITKTASTDPVYVGENLIYTVDITNSGPSTASDVIMIDTLPADVTYVSASSTKGICSQSGTQVTCSIDTMALNEVVTVTIIVTPTVPGTIRNVANVNGIEHDPAPDNNTATQDTTVLPSADLAITKIASSTTIYVGENLTYTIAVTNNGPRPATGVIMADTLPAGVTYVSASSTKGTCSHSEAQVTCDIGPIAINEVVTVTIIVTPTVPETITNTATVIGNEHDPDPNNNTATKNTTVLASTDLAITKTASTNPVYVGANLIYTVDITNSGPSTASDVIMIDTLPDGVTYVSASSTKGICSQLGTQVTCSIDTMTLNEVVTVTIIVTPTVPGTIRNVANVNGIEHDPNPNNNTATQDTTVLPSADLTITKIASSTTIYVGENLTYTVAVTNIGPSAATGVTMTDTLPDSVTYVSASSTKGTCSQSGTTITCDIDSIAINEDVTVTIIVTPTTSGTITNTANISGIEYDPDFSNNTATQETTVVLGEKVTLSSGIIQNLGLVYDGPFATDSALFLLNTDPNNSYTVTVTLYDRNWWQTPLPPDTKILTVAPNSSIFSILPLASLPAYEIRISYYHEAISGCNDESNDLLVVNSFGINNANYSTILGQTLLHDNFKKLKIPTQL